MSFKLGGYVLLDQEHAHVEVTANCTKADLRILTVPLG